MTTFYVTGAIVGILTAALVTVTVWLAKSRSAQVKAQTQNESLVQNQERHSEADKIMAEPVADEDAWLAAAIQRASAELHDRNRQP